MSDSNVIQRVRRGLASRLKRLLVKMFPRVMNRLYLLEYTFPEVEAAKSDAIQKLRVLVPAERVQFADPAKDAFVPASKYYREGWYQRPNIYACEIPEAALHVGTGLVCTQKMQAIPDFEYRVPYYYPIGQRKPAPMKRLAGTYSTVNSCFAWNIGHWWIDCLPRIHLLAKAEPNTKITLIMPESLGPVHRESMEYVLPPNFDVVYYPENTWLQVEKFIWVTPISGRCNYHLPTEYYDFMRRPIFARFGLPERHNPTARIYVTRRRARHRRVLNDSDVAALLAKYGFESVELEHLSFREQVELFHRAEVVVAPHGAGLNTIMFSGEIRVMVLYPTETPQNYFHTLAVGCGQKHSFLLHPGGEDSDFTVDLNRLKNWLDNELEAKPGVTVGK